MSNLISCPSCHTEIEITAALQSQLTAQIRREMEGELQAKQAELKIAHNQLEAQRQSLADEQEAYSVKVKAGIDAERAKILQEAKKAAADALALEMQDQTAQVVELQSKLRAARDNELEIRKRERELLEKTEELKLSAAREIHTQREAIRTSAMKQFVDPSTRIQDGFDRLVIHTYPNLKMLRGITYTEGNIEQCLNDSDDGLFGNDATVMSEAETEALSLIHRNSQKSIRTSIKAIPFPLRGESEAFWTNSVTPLLWSLRCDTLSSVAQAIGFRFNRLLPVRHSPI